jgi:hypothetical protein
MSAAKKEPAKSAKSSTLEAKVVCSSEDCGQETTLSFVGGSPFAAYRFKDLLWTIIEDMDEGQTMFLCGACAEPLRKEFEEQIANEERQQSRE